MLTRLINNKWQHEEVKVYSGIGGTPFKYVRLVEGPFEYKYVVWTKPSGKYHFDYCRQHWILDEDWLDS